MSDRVVFHRVLEDRWSEVKTCLCVGLDIDWQEVSSWFPPKLISLVEFTQQLVKVVSPYVSAFKLNHAFYAAQGLEVDLARIVAYIKETHPQIPVILDAKRGDIGNTAQRYAEEAYIRYRADAVTVNPFLGWDTIEPFLNYDDKGVLLLCRTSNAGSAWIQEFGGDQPVYVKIAERVHREANPNLQLVVGATQLEALTRVREIAPTTTVLVPGIGAQGGDLSEVLHRARRSDGLGVLVNCSRSIVSQGTDSDFFERVARAAEHYARLMSIR